MQKQFRRSAPRKRGPEILFGASRRKKGSKIFSRRNRKKSYGKHFLRRKRAKNSFSAKSCKKLKKFVFFAGSENVTKSYRKLFFFAALQVAKRNKRTNAVEWTEFGAVNGGERCSVFGVWCSVIYHTRL